MVNVVITGLIPTMELRLQLVSYLAGRWQYYFGHRVSLGV